jgi:hypothetical protein
MTHVHFVGGEKGGVGKSVVARLLAQFWIDHETPWTGFDADPSHGALLRYYDGFARSISVQHPKDLDSILEVAAGESAIPPAHVLVDLAAQSDRALHDWIDAAGVLDLAKDLGVGVLFWHVMDDGKDSVTLLDALFARYGERARYVVVLNRGRGEDFALFHGSATERRAAELGARVIELPALHKPTMLLIDQLDKSFWAATQRASGDANSSLGMMDRQRVKVWLQRVYAGFRGIEQLA